MYRRLSADEKVDGESNSVANQKKLIEYYLADKPELKIYKSYEDDGYTGTDFNRPGYKEMMKDIEDDVSGDYKKILLTLCNFNLKN